MHVYMCVWGSISGWECTWRVQLHAGGRGAAGRSSTSRRRHRRAPEETLGKEPPPPSERTCRATSHPTGKPRIKQSSYMYLIRCRSTICGEEGYSTTQYSIVAKSLIFIGKYTGPKPYEVGVAIMRECVKSICSKYLLFKSLQNLSYGRDIYK
jgi:hypothetical protein